MKPIGNWIAKHATMNGADISASFAGMQLEISNATYRVSVAGKEIDAGSLTFGADNQSIDIVGTVGPNTGKLIRCIFKMNANELTICYNLAPGGERPTQFESTAENKFLLVTYEAKK